MTAAKTAERLGARELRLAGMTYDQIADELGVSKSSLSLWLRDLPKPVVDPIAKARLMNDVRWDPHRRRTAKERQETKAGAAAEIGELSDRELLLVGVALYWAEGTKDKPSNPRRHEYLQFINSDPSVIRLYLRWLTLLGVSQEDLAYCVSIHESANVAEAERFWRELVGGGAAYFTKTTLKRHNPKTVRTNVGGNYRGCLTVRVRKSRRLYQQVEGWWAGISGQPITAYSESGESPLSRVV